MKKQLLGFAIMAILCSCSSLHVATYNVRHCAGPDEATSDYALTASVINELNVDVVGLQELDSCNVRSKDYQIAKLEEFTGMKGLYAKTIPYGGGAYGIGMLYKEKLGLVKSESVPLPGKEPRAFLVAEFKDFIYITTHLCYASLDNRIESAKIILNWLNENYPDCQKPVFLVGDFNEESMNPNNGLGRVMCKDWDILGSYGATFPSSKSKIDYICHLKRSGAISVDHCNVPTVKVADLNLVSDHYPLAAEIK